MRLAGLLGNMKVLSQAYVPARTASASGATCTADEIQTYSTTVQTCLSTITSCVTDAAGDADATKDCACTIFKCIADKLPNCDVSRAMATCTSPHAAFSVVFHGHVL